ncbi:hypothetical protein [Gracilimonas sp.]|uniref:hypothetical protein n=1 Tax=Gracilimonas sp. TaxID=1974203 RepID=UPI003BACB40D
MKKENLIFFAAILLFLTSCATASFTQTGPQKFPEYEGVVEVFYEQPQDVEFVEIGIVSSKGGSIHDSADLIKALQKKAAKNGANAIILVSNKESQGFVASQYYTGSTVEKEMSAIAIRVTNRN